MKAQQPGFAGKALTAAQLEETVDFFRTRLVGQPEVVEVLSNVLLRQNALLRYGLEHKEEKAGIPADPTVLLFVGGSWGKSLAARLIPMALSRYGLGSLTALTALPQDPEGSIYLDPRIVAVPFAVVLVEHIEAAYAMNARFVGNLAYVINAGLVPLADEIRGMVRPIPLGLATFVFTTGVGEEEIRQTLYPNGKAGFLKRRDLSVEDAYQKVQTICHQALRDLPQEILREVDETVIFRPLNEDDLREVFDLEIEYYEQGIFPGRKISVAFEPDAKQQVFSEALAMLDLYGIHVLRRKLQHHIDPVVYKAYIEGALTEENIETARVLVTLEGEQLKVKPDWG
ncbi:MAG: hypothetical protein H8E47_13940 [Anaerolineales bacterium]|nr:hypothetical protein [Anaerolineales bacterium]